jgi:hypothetical protein
MSLIKRLAAASLLATAAKTAQTLAKGSAEDQIKTY